MDTKTIIKLLKTYSCFKGVFPSDKLPYSAKLPLNIIANTDPSDKPGQHWVCLSINQRGKGYYFDSFGLPPMVSSLHEFLETRATAGWSYNRKQIQNIKSSTCGNYCVLYTIYKCSNRSNAQFMRQFGKSTLNNDIKMKKVFKDFSLVRRKFKRKHV